MWVRISQRFQAVTASVDLESEGNLLAQHALDKNDLTLVDQKIADGHLSHVYEGFATAEADAGHRALNNRREAETFGLQIDGESIVVLEFPENRKAAWIPD